MAANRGEQILVHKEKGHTLSLEEMRGVVDGLALSFSVPGETWRTECYWFAAPTAIGFEPIALWFPLIPIVKHVLEKDDSARLSRSFERWRLMLREIGLPTGHVGEPEAERKHETQTGHR